VTNKEKLLRATEQELARFANEIKAVWAKSEEEEREASVEERAEVGDLMKNIETLKEKKAELEKAIDVEKDVQRLSREVGPPPSEGIELKEGIDSVRSAMQVKSVGEQFVESEGYKSLIERVKSGNGLQQGASTGKIELKAGTLLEGGQGAGLIPVPQVVGGVTETLFERLTVADILPSGQTNTNSLRYVVEGTATSGAAAVAEGDAKPASDLALSTVDEPVQKIATILTVSDEMLEDAQAVQTYINSRLSLFVRIEEEAQLLSGNGTPPNISGLLDRAINTYAAGTVDDNAVAIFKALNGTRGSSFLEPTAIVMNPANWQATRLLQDTNGQFYGGGPFTGPYGGPQGPVPATYPAANALWGMRVVVTSAIGAGTAVLGAFDQAAQVFRRGGLTVEATNAHSDYFVKNLVAIRAEMREALAVFRPAAFTQVTGLD
jgi:HK97 family phage major capsid protein